jgi:cbb3-type cytochrome oxidase maturation protein
MSALLYLIPAALFLGLLGLAAFLWAQRSGQFDDLEGAANRILFDDDEDGEDEPAPDDGEDGRKDNGQDNQ